MSRLYDDLKSISEDEASSDPVKFSIRLPHEVDAKLEAMAKDLGHSKNWIIVCLIELAYEGSEK